MATFAIGTVVLVPFPFSDLSQSVKRPAVVLAQVKYGDIILCQITSNPYADHLAIELTDPNFRKGTLQRISYVRPSKLFTANEQLIIKEIGILQQSHVDLILARVISIFQNNS